MPLRGFPEARPVPVLLPESSLRRLLRRHNFCALSWDRHPGIFECWSGVTFDVPVSHTFSLSYFRSDASIFFNFGNRPRNGWLILLFLTRANLKAGNMRNSNGFFRRISFFSQEYFGYCKEKWRGTVGKDTLIGRFDRFQIRLKLCVIGKIVCRIWKSPRRNRQSSGQKSRWQSSLRCLAEMRAHRSAQ